MHHPSPLTSLAPWLQEFTETQLQSLRAELAAAAAARAAAQTRRDEAGAELEQTTADKAEVEREREGLFQKQNLQAKFSTKVRACGFDQTHATAGPWHSQNVVNQYKTASFFSLLQAERDTYLSEEREAIEAKRAEVSTQLEAARAELAALVGAADAATEAVEQHKAGKRGAEAAAQQALAAYQNAKAEQSEALDACGSATCVACSCAARARGVPERTGGAVGGARCVRFCLFWHPW